MAASLAPPRMTLYGAGNSPVPDMAAQTITYRKPGTTPPVFLAGSFSEPQWVPREMEYTQDPDGEYKYTCEIHAVPGHDYQFKFRVGEGDSWVLDENSPVETDSMGNKNNLLSVPRNGPPKATRSVPGKVLNELGLVDIDSRSSTPIEQVANTAAEVADTAESLEEDKSDTSSGFSWRSEDIAGTPLFAHESFGDYHVVGDAANHEGLGLRVPRSQPRSSSGEYPLDDVDVDINDPTIEKFPSDRGSVIDTLRKIQSSLGEDKVQVDSAPPSPRNVGWTASVDFAGDAQHSSGSLSPESPTASRGRSEDRLSRSSFDPKSAVSLGPIAEEPRPKSGEAAASQKPGLKKKPRGAVFDNPESAQSDTNSRDWAGEKVVSPRGGFSADPISPRS